MISPLRTYQTTPCAVAERGDAQTDRLDGADRLADVDHVTDPVLVLEQHEEPGDEVLDQVLRAEADRQSGDAGAGQQRAEVDAELAEHEHERDR